MGEPLNAIGWMIVSVRVEEKSEDGVTEPVSGRLSGFVRVSLVLVGVCLFINIFPGSILSPGIQMPSSSKISNLLIH